jgi:hypothetical protein
MGMISEIWTYLQNAVKNGAGVDRDLMQLLADGDIDRAKQLFQDRDNEVKEAIAEYNPDQHEIMKRPNKFRKDREPYRVQRLPRAWQRYINETALFFLLAKPVVWHEAEAGSETEAALKAYREFLKSVRFDVRLREMKRLAGAETEAAMLFHLYDDEGVPAVKVLILSMSKGYTLRPLFDRFNNMVAFGYGYYLKESGKAVEHFDILTKDFTYRCRKTGTSINWEIETVPNPAGKICAVYCRQPKEWEGADQRIIRDEYVDSKTADVNEYFADPQAAATADVIEHLVDPEAVGKLIQLTGENSRFEYIEPPTSINMKEFEKKTLRESILMDSFTPDFTYENMKGSGTLSGEALKRALILGFIKRDLRMEIYDELVDRAKNIMLAIMANVTHVSLKSEIERLHIEHEFAEPFDDDTSAVWQSVGRAYTDGIMSLETAVGLVGEANPVEELERIKAERQEKEEGIFYPVGQQ